MSNLSKMEIIKPIRHFSFLFKSLHKYEKEGVQNLF